MTDRHSANFMQLVLIFHSAAMQQMGKLKNPLTNKIERDLEQAHASIDMIDMLKERTKGNLSAEEEKFIGTILQELKLNYVDEVSKDEKPKAETEQPKAEEPGPSQTSEQGAKE